MGEQVRQWNEREVTIEGTFPLSGTLTVPETATAERPYPAVLLLSGSGKGDRDGNFKGMKLNLYKELADIVTKSGFVTLRYDKRGTHGSKGPDKNAYMKAGLWDFIDDAESAIRYVKQLPFVDEQRIIVLGHSEGAMIAPVLVTRQSLAGVIFVCGAAEAGQQLMWRQSRQLFEEINKLPGAKGKLLRFVMKLQNAEKRNEKIINKALQSDKDIVRIMGIVPLNAKWMRELYAFDVTAYLPQIACPTLAMAGGKDIQVAPEHAKVIAESVSGESEWHIIPNMNHILRTYSDTHTWLNLKKEYKQLVREPLSEEVTHIITSWLRTHFVYDGPDEP